MIKKITLAIIFVFFIGFVGWFAYQKLPPQSEKNENGKKFYPGEVVIGTETWPGYLLLYVARDKGYFKEQGLNIKIVRYDTLGQLSKGYTAGKMQCRANLTLDAVNEHLDGLDHKVILAIDYSNGSDAIMARPEIQSVKDFQNKRVGYEPNTLEEFFVRWALSENGLGISDVISVAGGPGETAQQLQEGKLDVAVSHEPFLSRFVKSGTFHRVYSSADAPGLITDVVTCRTDFLETYPDSIQLILDAYFRALNSWKENPNEAYAILAKEFGDTAESIAEQMKGITMLDERDNQTAFTFSAGLRSLYGNMRQIGKFVRSQRQAKLQQLDTDQLIEPKFIRTILNSKE